MGKAFRDDADAELLKRGQIFGGLGELADFRDDIFET
jgi:hypothetical protein